MTTPTLENPLRTGLRLEKTAEPCVVIIFGASGDLTKRKLVPALYRLSQERLLPAEFAIVGVALRHCERLHMLSLDVEAGASVSAVVERPQSGIHFRRKGAFEKALRGWTPDRLAKAMTMLGEASLDARVQSDLSETIARRALTTIARSAAQRG